MIRFDDVSKAHLGGNQQALQNISFHLNAGSMTYITGHSGAGKTTVLKLIMGIERANGGSVSFNGIDITRLPSKELPLLRRQIGMVHQDHRLLNGRTALDNVSLPLIVQGMSAELVRKDAMDALARVGLENKANYLVESLSGGEQQRVDIARAIVHNPKLLLADEPTGNLDYDMAFHIFNLFEEFNKQGMTVLIATHDTNMIRIKPKSCIELAQGRLKNIVILGE